MSYSTDYQRYKQKLERLQTKVKRSECARRELELRFQRLMRERNECEKTASIHKSKYNTLLERERKRSNRNEELLEMLEDVHAKATAMASNTERLKKLKNQHERILISNWRRSACMQQQMLYPNTAQYLAESSSIVSPSQPIHSYAQPNRALNCIPSAESVSTMVYDGSPYFAPVSNVVYENTNQKESPIIQMVDPVAHQSLVMGQMQYPTMMPIYHNQSTHPKSKQFHVRLHENQQYNQHIMKPAEEIKTLISTTFANPSGGAAPDMPYVYQSKIEPSAYDMTRINSLGDKSIHNKYSNSTLLQPNYVVGMRPLQKSNLDDPYNKTIYDTPIHMQSNKNSPQLYGNYSQQPKTSDTNQMPYSEATSNYNANAPINKPTSSFHSYEQHAIESIEPTSTYGQSGESVQRADKLYENKIQANSIDEYGKNAIETTNEPFAEDTDSDVYGHGRDFERKCVDQWRKSINNALTTTSVPVTAHSLPKCDKNVTLADAKASVSDDSTPQYSYEIESERSYTATMYPNSSNMLTSSSIINETQNTVNVQRAAQQFDHSNKSANVTEKRRSSIDAGSFAKSLGYDADTEKESIAANIRRRYSVAANFLNLPNETPTRFNANEWQNDTINRNNIKRETIDAMQTDTNRPIYNDDGKKSVARIEDIDDNTNEATTIAYNQAVTSLTNPSISQLPTNDNELNQNTIETNENYENNSYNGTNPYQAYPTDDQTYVENAMEQLNLGNDGEPLDQTNSGDDHDNANRARVTATHGKTVTWADDPQSNYKNENIQQTYEQHDAGTTNDNVPTDAYYANTSEAQHMQSGYATDGSIQDGMQTNTDQYQYENTNQYDNGQYQATDAPAENSNLYTNNDYYYGTEQTNQYDQYAAQPLQQEDSQQMQYYGNDATETSGNALNMPVDDYQPYETEPTQQPQPKTDDYYTVSPGENYYNDYENADQTSTYSSNANIRNVNQAANIGKSQTSQQQQLQQQPRQQQKQQQQQQQQQQNPQQRQQQHHNVQSQPNTHVPNYLQSDTDDSQRDYQTDAIHAKSSQGQDSDFDFSTNS